MSIGVVVCRSCRSNKGSEITEILQDTSKTNAGAMQEAKKLRGLRRCSEIEVASMLHTRRKWRLWLNSGVSI